MIKYSSLSKGERLWLARKRSGENQIDVARRMKVREQVYRAWEQGKDDERCPHVAIHVGLERNEQIALARRRKGYTIRAMAKRYGVSHVTVISWEKNRSKDEPMKTVDIAIAWWEKHGWPEKPVCHGEPLADAA